MLVARWHQAITQTNVDSPNVFCGFTWEYIHPRTTSEEVPIDLLPDTYNCGLRMRRECFPAADFKGNR